jgi:hypothetical protein
MRKAAALLLMVTMAACASGASSVGPTQGVLSGTVVGHLSDGTQQRPMGNVSVSVYRQAVPIGGPVLQNPPKPVASTTTNSEGVFEFRSLPAGRWFVAAGAGVWVNFDPAKGAVITIAVCTDCPVPL